MSKSRRSPCAFGVLAAWVVAVAPALAAPAPGAGSLPPDAEIRRILAERVEALAGPEGGVGIVVGVVGPEGRRVIAYGAADQGEARPLSGDTVFEIGSVTKAFTALLLADMVRRGEVALADPVAKHLPAGTKLPERGGRSITLVDLATHTSGLPFMPDELLANSGSTQATAADLYQYLAGYRLTREIGATWEYSNLGYWLLSQALSTAAGVDYESLLRARVLAPLKLASTDLTLSQSMSSRLAVGRNAALEPSPAVSSLPIYSLMPAAGGLYSTVDDLSSLLAVALDYEPSPLAGALALTVDTRRPASRPGTEHALGWTVLGGGGDRLVFRDGGTFGHASCIVWDPARRVGVVVLSNHVASVSDIARHLLRRDFPLEKPTVTKRTEIALDVALLDRYVGRYEAADEGVFTIAREDGFLTIEAPAEWGLPKLRIRPESQQDFFATELPLRVTFQVENDGHVSGILIYPPRGQKAILAGRLGSTSDG